MSANPSQLLLLSDHIKLSLLERQRAISLNLQPNSQDGQISRSLDTFREGLEAIAAERIRLEAASDPNVPSPRPQPASGTSLTSFHRSSSSLHDQELRLQKQYQDLTSQFRGFPPSPASSSINLTQPNDPSLAPSFDHARTRPSTTRAKHVTSPKSVRFTDALPTDDYDDHNRAQLFPYTDDAPSTTPDPSSLKNPQLLQHHAAILSEQDAQLDTLGESISRQRELSIQIGDELEGHVRLLDEVDEHVDRHQGRLEVARRRLGGVARGASGNKGGVTILVLVLVLIMLVAILKT